ncbi:TraR/DksA C4-type zinc finger protein [Nocardia sp. CA-119907]|uniref:TraR/DksA C4-type zinc finger protein n=1 Tax=Nocardia sp. CA-119907 TaxID=3239973 RepID=UPI003D968592
MTTGRYGRCLSCHGEIPIHLLQTIPTTQRCLNCRRHLPAFDSSRPMRGQLPRAASRTPRRGPLAQRKTQRPPSGQSWPNSATPARRSPRLDDLGQRRSCADERKSALGDSDQTGVERFE